MSKNDIIGHVADWFNVNGEETFDDAVKNKIIVNEKDEWKLATSMSEAIAEQGDLKQDIPVSQAFSDEGNNPHIDTKLGKPFDEKSDTGDDQSRTDPGGNNPQDNYDSIHYTGTSDTKIHIPTPFYDGKEPHDVSGIVPEYQEDIRITIEDPLQDENIPKIVLDIGDVTIPVEEKPKPKIKLDSTDLKHTGRKDPGTHVNTIKAGNIDKNLQISSLWKEKNDGIGEEGSRMKEFNFSEAIDPSEEKGFTHTSSFVGNAKYYPDTQGMSIILNGKQYEYCNVPERIFDAFEGAGSKGAYYNREIKNLFNCGMSESLNIYKDKAPDEFDWVDADAMKEMKNYAISHGNGKFILAVVSGDSITDHRIEGKDQHRRHWTEEELMQNIRTGKGKLTDINHLWEKKDPYSGGIYDANWNFKTHKGEMILWETDAEIIDAIRKNVITAVSINTGNPRKVDIQCETGECFITPKGVNLGEDNGVGLAFVVTAPEGFVYNGQWIPGMPPGMKFTKLYLVE